jgi:hypothetical protein
MGLAALVAAAALAATPASYVESSQQADGGFAEPGGRSTGGLTAWAMLGLTAVGRPTGKGFDYLLAHERELQTATDIELAVLAEASAEPRGRLSETLHARFVNLGRPDGRTPRSDGRSRCGSPTCFAISIARGVGAGSLEPHRIRTTPLR